MGQDSAAAEASQPVASPITTADPAIPVDQLNLLLKPLTQDELKVEVDGWRGLLRSKLMEIGGVQIAMLKESQAEDATEAENAAQSGTTVAEESRSDQAAADQAAVGEAKETADEVVGLQEDQVVLVERLNVAIDALEKKGGDVEGERQYVNAVTGIEIQVTDARTTWALIMGWLKSEQGGMRWLWNIIKFLCILAGFYFGASLVAKLVRHAVSRVKGSSQLLVSFAGTFVKQLLMVIGFIVALAALEVNIAPLLAAVGATGFVVGLALQGTLSNFASGLLILFYRPFDVGDVIDAGGVSGIVNSVSLVSTHVRTFDNKVMIVPNNDIWGGTITNATASETRRVDMVFGIGYSDDTDLAKSILETTVREHPLVLEDPAPVIELHELADSSVNFVCRPWAANSDYWAVYWGVTKTVKQEFDRQGISIPFPQRDVHVYHETQSQTSI